jgi:hypothetical protein
VVLAQKQQGDEKGVVELEVQEQAHLLEDLDLGQELALIHHQDSGLAGSVVLVEQFLEAVDQASPVLLLDLLAQLIEHFAQEFFGGLAGLVDQGDFRAPRGQLPEQGAGHQGLAATRPSGQQGRAAPFLEHIKQPGPQFGAGRRLIEEPGVRRVFEGLFAQPPVRFVQRKTPLCLAADLALPSPQVRIY